MHHILRHHAILILITLTAVSTNACSNNKDATTRALRSQASALAADIADRMRANRNAALNGQYDLALTDATPSGDNAFKIELARRIMTRALTLAAAGTPERVPALPASPFASGTASGSGVHPHV